MNSIQALRNAQAIESAREGAKLCEKRAAQQRSDMLNIQARRNAQAFKAAKEGARLCEKRAEQRRRDMINACN